MPIDDDNDPLWLHSPHKRRLFRIACYLAFIGVGAVLVGSITGSFWGYLAGAAAMGFGVVNARGWIHDALDSGISGFRAWTWRHRQGRHFAFAGIALDIHDDGREPWISERSVRAVLDLQKDPALKARFAHQWRDSTELGLTGKGLWIKVSALHQHLAEAPERMDPRRLRLRTYLDRDVLQPLARQRGRAD